MAHTKGHVELVRQALEHKYGYQVKLAELDGTDPPEPENPWAFTGHGSAPPGMPPTQPSGVPRRPLPSAGSSAIALPLPEPEQDPEAD